MFSQHKGIMSGCVWCYFWEALLYSCCSVTSLLLWFPGPKVQPRTKLFPTRHPSIPLSITTRQVGWKAGWGTVSPSKLENEGKEDHWWWPGEWCVCVYVVCSVKPAAVTKPLSSRRSELQANPGILGGVPTTCLALGLVLGTLEEKSGSSWVEKPG